MTKSRSNSTGFTEESDSRFPRARVLIVGHETSLARALLDAPSSVGQQRLVLPGDINPLQDNQIFEAIRLRRPDFVINTVVDSGVDAAEHDPTRCRQINHDVAVGLAIACREFGATLLQLSTDYIFDGQKDMAYFEDDAPNPLNLFGQTRLEAERDIASLLDQHILLRVSHLFAPGPQTFVGQLIARARVERALPMIADERGCPTSVDDIARIITAMIDQLHAGGGAYGVFHVAGQGDASWSELAEVVIAQARQFEHLAVEDILPIEGHSIAGRARRPKRLILSARKLLYTFGIKPRAWRQELASTVAAHYMQKKEQGSCESEMSVQSFGNG